MSVSGVTAARSARPGDPADPGDIRRWEQRRQPKVQRIDAARLAAVKEQQILLALVQQLDQAQFRRGDRELSRRLWEEVGLLNLDPERVIHLLYAGVDPEDRQALQELDNRWCAQEPQRRGGPWSATSWLRGATFMRRPSGGHRTARPAAAPSHRGGR